jgi:hypothetical protein
VDRRSIRREASHGTVAPFSNSGDAMQVEIRTNFRRTARIIKDDRDFRRAASRMPKPVSWDWARPRLMPLLAQPCIDMPGEERIRTVAPVGCAIEFGIDLGGHFPIVDRVVAERWECSVEQLWATALENLAKRASIVQPSVVQHAVMSGRAFRMLQAPAGCASSLLLVPDQVKRLFGDHDQVLAAPGRHTLLSFPLDAPTLGIGEIVVDIEQGELTPLFLDPFAMYDGEVIWEGDGGLDDLDDDLPDAS